MRSIVMALVVCVALTVRADAVPLCGYVVQMLCPGCSSSSPSDSTCYCGPHEGQCVCRKVSGGIQTGLTTVCYIGDFNWIDDPNGRVITADVTNQPLCSRTYRCQTAGGSQVDCAQLSGHSCIGGGVETCSWRVFGEYTLPKFLEGAACP
ncbi:MAG TPA: hypothetical protein PKC49_11175 [Phycisphaerae bacterium]|nr:hypothetical protein [Phycisphaerae bacterium]